MYTTMLGLIAATGLRISEAIRLRLGDFTVSGLIKVPEEPTHSSAPDDAVFLFERSVGLRYPTFREGPRAHARALTRYVRDMEIPKVSLRDSGRRIDAG